MIQALVEYVARCCAVAGNQAGTISGKLAAIQYFHRADHGRELPINSAPVKRALQGVTRAGNASSHSPACIMVVSVGRARAVRFLGHWWTRVVAVFGVIVPPSCAFG